MNIFKPTNQFTHGQPNLLSFYTSCTIENLHHISTHEQFKTNGQNTDKTLTKAGEIQHSCNVNKANNVYAP